jgi:sarcosine oxidase
MPTPARIPGHRPDVAVVGGGIVGLCCAWWLRAAGASVVLFDPSPGTGYSLGAGRMFRHAHRAPEHARLAARASLLWDEMTNRLSQVDRPLLARIGALHTMPRRDALAPLERSLQETEHDYQVLPPGSVAGRWPELAIDPPAALFDPHGGRIEAAAAIRALRDDLEEQIALARVDGLRAGGPGPDVQVLAGPTSVTVRSVIVCAGIETPRLVAPLGMRIAMDRPLAATRLTFRPAAGETPDIPCIHERSGALAENISYLFPGEWGGLSLGLPSLPEMLTESLLRRIGSALGAALPGPAWVREAEVAARLEVLDDSDHDRIELHRQGPVWAIAGWNMFKHAPAIGEGMAALLAGEPVAALDALPGERSDDPTRGGARRTAE